MNPEIYTILDDMKQRSPKDPVIATSDKQTYLSIQSSRLFVLLAEETEKSTNENVKMQRTITKLTWAMLFVSVVLLVISAFQVYQSENHKNDQRQTQEKRQQQNSVPVSPAVPQRANDVHK